MFYLQKSKPQQLSLEATRNLLVCLLWVLKNMDSQVLKDWWADQPSSRYKEIGSIYWVNNKHLMTGPEGNSKFCFPRDQSWNDLWYSWKFIKPRCNRGLLPSDAMLLAQRFWRETVSLLDVMWPNQWEHALLGINFQLHNKGIWPPEREWEADFLISGPLFHSRIGWAFPAHLNKASWKSVMSIVTYFFGIFNFTKLVFELSLMFAFCSFLGS